MSNNNMWIWDAADLHADMTIEIGDESLEVTNVEYLGDGTYLVNGIRNSDGEPDSFELASDASVKVTAF